MKEFVVAVDLQYDFTVGSLRTKEAREIIPDVVEYIKTHHAHYIFTRDTHDAQYLETHEGKMLPIVHCVKNSAGWRIDENVMDAVQNMNWTYSIVDKNTFGSAAVENIIRILIKHVQQGLYDPSTDGRDIRITVFGLVTDICVVSNAIMLRSAFPEAEINVVENCCAGTTPERHAAALEVMKSCHINIINTKNG